MNSRLQLFEQKHPNATMTAQDLTSLKGGFWRRFRLFFHKGGDKRKRPTGRS